MESDRRKWSRVIWGGAGGWGGVKSRGLSLGLDVEGKGREAVRYVSWLVEL